MGCNASRLDGNGFTLPPRLRPLFLQRLNEIKASRHGPALKDPTPSKKELLLHDDQDDNATSHQQYRSPTVCERMVYSPVDSIDKTQEAKEKQPEKPKEEANRQIEGRKGENGTKEGLAEDTKPKFEDAMTDGDNEDEDDEEDGNDERMIGYEDDEAFPGSPSFRAYFKDDEEHNDNDIGKDVTPKHTASSDADSSSKESNSENIKKKMKKGRKRRSFSLPKGGQVAVKNLLNVRSCYTSSSHSSHGHTRLLAGKTAT